MTYEEYRELYKEWKTNDSKRREKKIRDTIADSARELLNKLVKMYGKRGLDYVDDDDYRTDRGGTSFDGCNESTVFLSYHDHWAYGGECDIDIDVPMKYLDEAEFNKLDEELRKKQLETLEETLQSKKAEIEYLTKSIGEIEAKIEELGKESGK